MPPFDFMDRSPNSSLPNVEGNRSTVKQGVIPSRPTQRLNVKVSRRQKNMAAFMHYCDPRTWARIKAQDLYWKILYRQLGSVDLVASVE
jgi:hypothetical protein